MREPTRTYARRSPRNLTVEALTESLIFVKAVLGLRRT
jgi:hypothetical protein